MKPIAVSLNARIEVPRPADQYADTLAICLKDRDTAARWRFAVYVRGDGGDYLLGRFTSAATGGGPDGRVVAIASCPGARRWTVVPEALVAGTGEGSTLELRTAPDLTTPGVVPTGL